MQCFSSSIIFCRPRTCPPIILSRRANLLLISFFIYSYNTPVGYLCQIQKIDFIEITYILISNSSLKGGVNMNTTSPTFGRVNRANLEKAKIYRTPHIHDKKIDE